MIQGERKQITACEAAWGRLYQASTVSVLRSDESNINEKVYSEINPEMMNRNTVENS